MDDRQSMSSYNPNTAGSYNPNAASSYNPNAASSYNPNTASGYNPNTASSYNPNTAGSYNPNTASSYNPNTASSYNPNPAGSYNPNAAGSYNPNAASSYNPTPAAFETAQPQAGGYGAPNLSKETAGVGGGYAEQEAFVPSQPAEEPNSAKAVLFVIAFIGGIIGMVVASQTKPVLCLSIFGAMFMLFGFAAMAGTKNKYPEEKMVPCIFTIGGLIAFALPIVILRMKSSGMPAETFEKYRNIFIGGSFALIGLAVMIFPNLANSMKKHRCTFPVEGTCVGHNSRIQRSTSTRRGHRHHYSHKVYAPIWEYFCDGRLIKNAENVYSNVNVPQVGDVCELMVNPNDPMDFYRHIGGTVILTIFIGLLFVAAGLTAMFI